MFPNLYDAQTTLAFLVSQLTQIEAQVYETRYPDFAFEDIVPVDVSGPEWKPSTTFFSTDFVGEANWFTGYAKDMPFADVTKSQFTQGMKMAAIGYEWNLEEINTARMIGQNLDAAKANAARKVYQKFMYDLVTAGSTEKNMPGFFNISGVTAGDVAADGTASSTFWPDKTALLILRDINALLTAIYTGSSTVESADTLLLPVNAFLHIANTPMSVDNPMTILEFIRRNNTYTAMFNRPLTIRPVRGLDTADPGGDGRMIAYRKDPEVVKLHLPMPHRFLPIWQNGPLNFVVPGIFRTGGIEARLPAAIRYGDGIWNS